MYELKSRMSNDELAFLLKGIYNEIEGRIYKHSNGESYQVVDACIVNFGGKAYASVVYCPFEKGRTISDVRHVRPLDEFLDGRFAEVL